MTDQPIPTTERLALALEAAGAPQDMIARARAGFYDDFKSEDAMSIVRLVEHANTHGLYGIADRAMNGEFDATPEEGDEWMMSPEGQETFRQLIGDAHPTSEDVFNAHLGVLERGTRPKNPYSSKKKRRRRG